MQTEINKKPEMVAVPRLEIYEIGAVKTEPEIYGLEKAALPSKYGPHVFEGQIGTDITDFGLPLEKTIDREITLADQNTLFQAYMMNKFCNIPLPAHVKKVVYKLFDTFGRGNKTSTLVDYNNGDCSISKTKDSDRRVKVIVNAKRFWRDADGTVKYTPADDSKILNKIIPATGYNEWTCDGGWDPETGFAFSTNSSRKVAVKTWTDKGFPKDFAEEIVSYLYTRNESEGISGVGRRCFDGCYGHFGVGAGWYPESRGPDWGSFPASRQPSGARHVTESTNK